MFRRLRPTTVALTALVGLAAVLRFWGLDFGLPHTQARPDETQVINVALQFIQGNLQPNFFDYPWLYMKFSAAAYLGYYGLGLTAGWFTSIADFVRSWPQNWEPFFLINRSISAVCGTLTVVALYSVTRRLYDRATALSAAALLATAFLHVRESHYGTTDAMMTLFVMLSTVWLVDGHQTGRPRSFVLAGVLGGLAAATKYNAGIVMFPVIVSQIIQMGDAFTHRQRPRFDGRVFWFGVPSALAFMVGGHFLLHDFDRFQVAMTALSASMATGHGTGGVALSNGWLQHLQYSLLPGVGAPMLAFAALGIGLSLRRDWRLALVLLTLPIGYFLVIGSVRNLFFRYALPLVPFLCLLAAHAILQTTRRLTRSAPGWALVAAALLTVVVAAPSAYSVVRYNHVASRTDSRVMLSRWFLSSVPHQATIVQSGSPYGYAQFPPDTFTTWPWDRRLRSFVDRSGRHAEGLPDYIVLQESPLPSTTQPEVIAWLAQGYDLAHQIRAFSTNRDRVYDLQDAFFIPIAGFAGVERPGPNFLVYRKRE